MERKRKENRKGKKNKKRSLHHPLFKILVPRIIPLRFVDLSHTLPFRPSFIHVVKILLVEFSIFPSKEFLGYYRIRMVMIPLKEVGRYRCRSRCAWFLFVKSLHLPMRVFEVIGYLPSCFFVRVTFPFHQVFQSSHSTSSSGF